MKTICKHGVNLSITACGQCIIEDCQKTIAMIEADHAENDRKRAAVTVEGEYTNEALNGAFALEFNGFGEEEKCPARSA